MLTCWPAHINNYCWGRYAPIIYLIFSVACKTILSIARLVRACKHTDSWYQNWVCWWRTSFVVSQFLTWSIDFPFKYPNQIIHLHTQQRTCHCLTHYFTHLARCSSSAAVLGQFQHGPVALATGGAVEAVRTIVMDPLMVAEISSQAEGLSTQVAHVTFLTVDSHMVAQGHVVGVRLVTEVTSVIKVNQCD